MTDTDQDRLPTVTLPGLAPLLGSRQVTLLDVADHLLDRGVVLAGEATISLAGVDLIFLGLNLALTSVETLRTAPAEPGPEGRWPGAPAEPRVPSAPAPSVFRAAPATDSAVGEPSAPSELPVPAPWPRERSEQIPPAQPASPASAGEQAPRAQRARPQIDIDPDRPEQGLAKLVLTLVEFLRQLLERQAIRRMDGGALSEAEVERMGLALLRLEEKLRELAGQIGLTPEDLTIDLGPLGNLL